MSHLDGDRAISRSDGSAKQSNQEYNCNSKNKVSHHRYILPRICSVAHIVTTIIISLLQSDSTRRYDSGNSVLVYHLAHAVFQQYYKLIERIDLTLQLDSIHQVDRDGNSFFPQRI